VDYFAIEESIEELQQRALLKRMTDVAAIYICPAGYFVSVLSELVQQHEGMGRLC
jgi:hypothetical protein